MNSLCLLLDQIPYYNFPKPTYFIIDLHRYGHYDIVSVPVLRKDKAEYLGLMKSRKKKSSILDHIGVIFFTLSSTVEMTEERGMR
jgi:xanthine/CO dehydrogenase XdhC/CoxF family maturation factor